MMMIGAAEPLRGPAHDLHHRRRFLRRKTGTGLVKQQYPRLGQERHREFEDLLLTVRKFRRFAGAEARNG